MEIMNFFEKLATNAHHQIDLNHLLNTLPVELKIAYCENDIESIKMQLGHDYLANESHVASF